jgi:predicted ATPase
MLEKIRIQNFKCLQDTEVSLGPFNVLIGPNDSGKTSLLQAIELLGASQFGDTNLLVWEKDRERKIVLDASGHAKKAFRFQLEIPATTGGCREVLHIDQKMTFETIDQGQMTVVRGYNPAFNLAPVQRALMHVAAYERNQNALSAPVADVLEVLQSSRTFQLDPHAMRSVVQATPNPLLLPTGGNLAAVLQAMLSGPDRQATLDLESKLHDEIPTLKGVSTPLASPNAMYQIEFTLATDSKLPITIPCSQASDGAMLLTGFLTLVYGNTPKRLLIEEPENGLHPSRLKMVVDILRKISTGEIGNEPRQVILTTHSPLLLNFVQPEEVRVFRRDEKEGTKVVSMDKIPNIAKLRKEFAPGELWYLFGEEELVRGKAS